MTILTELQTEKFFSLCPHSLRISAFHRRNRCCRRDAYGNCETLEGDKPSKTFTTRNQIKIALSLMKSSIKYFPASQRNELIKYFDGSKLLFTPAKDKQMIKNKKRKRKLWHRSSFRMQTLRRSKTMELSFQHHTWLSSPRLGLKAKQREEFFPVLS